MMDQKGLISKKEIQKTLCLSVLRRDNSKKNNESEVIKFGTYADLEPGWVCFLIQQVKAEIMDKGWTWVTINKYIIFN